MKKAAVLLADGFEEIEALTAVDLLRRARIYVDTVSISDDYMVHGAHGINVQTEDLFEEVNFAEFDMIILPGGMPGTLNLKAHEGLRSLLKTYDEEKKYIAAICAAPSILSELGMIKGRKACAYPSFEDELDCEEVLKVPEMVDGHIITGRGMGAAIPFALRLTSLLCGDAKSEEIRKSIVYNV